MRSVTIKIIAYVFFFAAGAMIGWIASTQWNTAPEAGSETVYDTAQAAESTPAAVEGTEEEHYLVTAAKGRLCLFRIRGDETALIKSTDISENLYPLYDRTVLKTGIEADTREEAMMIWENFAE